jgi:hypothetical protein
VAVLFFYLDFHVQRRGRVTDPDCGRIVGLHFSLDLVHDGSVDLCRGDRFFKRLPAWMCSALLDNYDLVFAIYFFKFQSHLAVLRQINFLRNKIGGDGKFTTAPIYEHGEMDGFGTSQVNEMIDGRSDRSAGVQDIVKQDNRPVIDVEWDARVIDLTLGQEGIEIVTIEGDVHLAQGHFFAIGPFNDLTQPLGKEKASGSDADEG